MRRIRVPLVLLLLPCSLPAAHAADTELPTTPAEVRELAEAGKSFRGAALAGMDLAALRSSGLDLRGTNWARADLRGASFSAVNLAGASLDEAIARGARFVDCEMVGVTMRHADLSGALFRGVQLAGADLAGSRLHGAEFDGVMYSRTGGRHTSAIAVALATLAAAEPEVGVSPWTPPLAAGLSGDAFAFVYNTADARQWPLAPFTESPVRAAMAAAGHDVTALFDLSAARATEALVEALQGGKVCLLPLSLAGEEIQGADLKQAFWAAAVTMNDIERPARAVLLVPPFGRREYVPAQLADRWAGPWPTLAPAGAERSEARHPMYVISRGEAPRPPREAVLAALRHATAIVNDRRTYGALVPGVPGLERLAEDLNRAARSGDVQLVSALAAWDGTPRRLLISARRQAAEFLEQAADVMLPMERPDMARAAALYRNEVDILANRFPALKTDATLTMEETRARYARAAGVISEVARIEAAAARVFTEIAG